MNSENQKSAIVRTLIIAGVMSGSLFSASVQAQVSGAIFTNKYIDSATCTGIDLNIYASKQEVGLNGGPARLNAAALPNGSYYVKITEPNGNLLGSSLDTAPVVVSNGKTVACYKLWDITKIQYTNSDGSLGYRNGYSDTSNPGGEYKVWISQNKNFPLSETKTDNFKVKEIVPPASEQAKFTVIKYYDANANGTLDNGEIQINGWRVDVTTPDSSMSPETTPAVFSGSPGNYSAVELDATELNWKHTTATSFSYTIAANNSATAAFGNVCLGAGNGLTLGFWSNKNGASRILQMAGANSVATLLNGLNLRNANGSLFVPGGTTAFQTWILKADAVNMAYMLSAQLAAMKLNVLSGNVSGSAMVYAPGAPSANAFSFVSIDKLIADAVAALADPNGLTAAAGFVRTLQEAIKTALDKANNNLNFVQAGPESCPFSFTTY